MEEGGETFHDDEDGHCGGMCQRVPTEENKAKDEPVRVNHIANMATVTMTPATPSIPKDLLRVMSHRTSDNCA